MWGLPDPGDGRPLAVVPVVLLLVVASTAGSSAAWSAETDGPIATTSDEPVQLHPGPGSGLVDGPTRSDWESAFGPNVQNCLYTFISITNVGTTEQTVTIQPYGLNGSPVDGGRYEPTEDTVTVKSFEPQGSLQPSSSDTTVDDGGNGRSQERVTVELFDPEGNEDAQESMLPPAPWRPIGLSARSPGVRGCFVPAPGYVDEDGEPVALPPLPALLDPTTGRATPLASGAPPANALWQLHSESGFDSSMMLFGLEDGHLRIVTSVTDADLIPWAAGIFTTTHSFAGFTLTWCQKERRPPGGPPKGEANPPRYLLSGVDAVDRCRVHGHLELTTGQFVPDDPSAVSRTADPLVTSLHPDNPALGDVTGTFDPETLAFTADAPSGATPPIPGTFVPLFGPDRAFVVDTALVGSDAVDDRPTPVPSKPVTSNPATLAPVGTPLPPSSDATHTQQSPMPYESSPEKGVPTDVVTPHRALTAVPTIPGPGGTPAAPRTLPARRTPDATTFEPVGGVAPWPVVWYFGDGEVGVGRRVTHTYTDSGDVTAAAVLLPPGTDPEAWVNRPEPDAPPGSDGFVEALVRRGALLVEPVDLHVQNPDLFETLSSKTHAYNDNLDRVPGTIKRVVGNERINAEVDLSNGSTLHVVARMAADGAVTTFERGRLDHPTLVATTDEETAWEIARADDPADAALHAVRDGRIRWHGRGNAVAIVKAEVVKVVVKVYVVVTDFLG